MSQSSFVSYQALLIALKRSGVSEPGTTATTLLECFISNKGNLKAGLVEERGLCKPGSFKIWREDLINKGWLNYTIGEYSRHEPGPKLLKYINREKSSRFEIATIKEVKHVEEKIEKTRDELQAQIDLLKQAIHQMIEEFDPPVTDIKVQKRLSLVKG